MIGRITHINRPRGMFAILTDDGYSIAEILGVDPFELGDVLVWREATALGGEVVENQTQRCSVEVYFQNHHVSEGNLRQQLLVD